MKFKELLTSFIEIATSKLGGTPEVIRLGEDLFGIISEFENIPLILDSSFPKTGVAAYRGKTAVTCRFDPKDLI